jgi:hypothetical protein
MINHLTIAFFYQYLTLYKYFYFYNLTPDPPYSFPNALRIIVIGSIGVSFDTSCGFTETIPKSY